MKKILAGLIALLLVNSFCCSCGGGEEMKTEVPRKLAGVHYERTNGSVANDEFYIYVTPYNFVAEYWPDNEDEWVYDEVTTGWTITEKTGTVSEEQWKEIEETILALYPEIVPQKNKDEDGFWAKLRKKFIKEPFLLDGGDKTSFSLEWYTEDGIGIETEHLQDPWGNNGLRLYRLLQELADPIGREIPALEP